MGFGGGGGGGLSFAGPLGPSLKSKKAARACGLLLFVNSTPPQQLYPQGEGCHILSEKGDHKATAHCAVCGHIAPSHMVS